MSVGTDFKWIGQNYSELQDKYANQFIAVKNRKIVAHGRDVKRVYDTAKRKVKKDFVTEYVKSGEILILQINLRSL